MEGRDRKRCERGERDELRRERFCETETEGGKERESERQRDKVIEGKQIYTIFFDQKETCILFKKKILRDKKRKRERYKEREGKIDLYNIL